MLAALKAIAGHGVELAFRMVNGASPRKHIHKAMNMYIAVRMMSVTSVGNAPARAHYKLIIIQF